MVIFPTTLRERAFYFVGGFLDTASIVSLVILIGLALFGAGCNFITEGEPSESSSSSDGEPLPRWPYDPDASTSTSSPATSTSSSSSTSTTSTTSPATSESGESSESSSSSDGGESSSSSDGESSSSSSGDAGDCEHDLCAGGVALQLGCSDCVDAVCGVDDYCCERSWDQQCIDHADELCGGICS